MRGCCGVWPSGRWPRLNRAKRSNRESHELGVYLVDPVEMAGANWDYLQHFGPTDVITFDYGEPGDAPKPGADPWRYFHLPRGG